MFEKFTERAKRVIFLARELASTKGTAAVIEPCHLLDALVREDQGEIAARMPNVVRIQNSELRPERILPPKTAPIPLSKDMPMSPALEQIFTAAMKFANEQNSKQVEPLHLVAAVLSQESERTSEILKRVDISEEIANGCHSQRLWW